MLCNPFKLFLSSGKTLVCESITLFESLVFIPQSFISEKQARNAKQCIFIFNVRVENAVPFCTI